MRLSVQLTTLRQDAAVIAVEGELDGATAPLLNAVLLPLLGQGVLHLIVAGDRLRFCEPRGLRVLADVHTIAATIGGALTIAGLTPVLRGLLALTQTPSTPPIARIKVYDSLDHALRGELGYPCSSMRRRLAGSGCLAAPRPGVPR